MGERRKVSKEVDIKAYIESGILEAYVLDTLDPTERAEVQSYISTYPEIAAEVAAIEGAMLSYAEASSEAPPAHMQEKIWQALTGEAANAPNKTIPLAPVERRRQYRWANAAMLIALVGSMGINILFWYQKGGTETELATARQHLEMTQQQQAALITEVAKYKQEKDMMANPDMISVPMKSLKPGQDMVATVYWNKTKGEAYLHMQKLPAPAKGKQYQMWVIQDGKPVSMGVLPVEVAEGKMIPKFPMEIKEGQAFAISLENIGGSATPTEVYVLGKVS